MMRTNTKPAYTVTELVTVMGIVITLAILTLSIGYWTRKHLLNPTSKGMQYFNPTDNSYLDAYNRTIHPGASKQRREDQMGDFADKVQAWKHKDELIEREARRQREREQEQRNRNNR